MNDSVAKALWEARIEGKSIAVDEALRPATEDAAYEIQTAQLALSDARAVGWKLGAGSDAALAMLGLSEPFVAPLLAPHLYCDGATVPVHACQGTFLETEFLVRMGVPLAPRTEPYTIEDVSMAVIDVLPAFEIVACRFAGGFAGNGRLVIADGGMGHAVIQGTRTGDWHDLDLSAHTASVTLNGKETARGDYGSLLWGHPFAAVAWLANQRLLAGRGLIEGDFVMTGTVAGVIPLKPGDQAMADFGTLGTVRGTFAG
jgi:2-keto-4-pentenoate hydratase